MKSPNYVFIGWLKEGQSDKVWGIIELAKPSSQFALGKYLTFWGRRGSKYQTKVVSSGMPYHPFWGCTVLDKKITEKIDKGYRSVQKDQLEKVYPEFEKDLQATTFWTLMTKSAEVGSVDWDKIMKKE